MTTAPFPAAAGQLRPQVGASLPAGEVTFMFTDIEGSTRLASGLGAEHYRIVLHRHRALIREVLAAHRGTEIETEGDSFFVVFADAADAAGAAVDIQTALRGAEWPDLGRGAGPIRPRVRMGLHTGEAWPSAGGYATPEVHRTARICSAAHGDQILASSQHVTAAGLDPHRSVEVLGAFELRGLPGVTELVQLGAPGLPVEFPPPPIQPLKHHLPADLKIPIDRPEEYQALDRAFDKYRLVTVTGLHGSGKSTLITSWARRRLRICGGGVWYCRPGDDLGTAILEAVGRRPDPLLRPLESAICHLKGRSDLLVIDDVERDHAWAVEKLLRECPDLRILAAGVRPLELPGEAKRALSLLPHGLAAELVSGLCEDRGAVWSAAECRGLAAAVEGFVPALSALADYTAFASPAAALRRLRDDPLAILDAGGRFRASVDEAIALISGPAREVLLELAERSGGATVDEVLDLSRQRDGSLEALVELVDVALVVIERPAMEQALYRVPTPVRWLLGGPAEVQPAPVPPVAAAVRLSRRLVNVVDIGRLVRTASLRGDDAIRRGRAAAESHECVRAVVSRTCAPSCSPIPARVRPRGRLIHLCAVMFADSGTSASVRSY
ncbi:adenylate/guanylate cyclase domain-containing protein [Glycomyces buryatensis]|uniref:Adenylate/guanylate cyclase domain-containing protein n=1 Tax=Glycomyces buryatensis TaxID=2570927 RepID=A0A4S8QFV7_9ACTN|nr:adenylate/guanylate cyclase domain-containing protein [Glycomyces buryatensis]THV43308.1 adenylate/guanylate cyclase domain-containing protein [Glycomyces buryatensis]